jgi:hypothetical protein
MIDSKSKDKSRITIHELSALHISIPWV